MKHILKIRMFVLIFKICGVPQYCVVAINVRSVMGRIRYIIGLQFIRKLWINNYG